MNNPQSPRLLPIKEAAEYLSVSKDTMYRLIHDAVLPHVRFKELGNIYIDRNDLDKYVERNKYNCN